MYIERYNEDIIEEIHRTFKVLYVGGPRQVGKTTTLQHLAQRYGLGYISLDMVEERRLAQKDPDLFLQRKPAPLLIDEVQYAPQLFSYIKARVDQSDQMGQYWITGSQQFSLMKNVQESLAGRVGILHMLGLSLAELQGYPFSPEPFTPLVSRGRKVTDIDTRRLFEYIVRGSYPALWRQPAPSLERFYGSYIQTYIDRDLREIFGVEKIEEFHTFLELCAARTGQMLNYSDLAQDAGISVHAAREWMNILVSTMQVYLLRPYYKNIPSQIKKTPKLYMLDTGLAAYLTKWKTAEQLEVGAMAGPMLETFAVGQIVRSFLFRGKQPPIYYFRDKQKREVDIIIDHDRTLYPLEVKKASHISSKAGISFNYLREWLDLGPGAILSLSQRQYALDSNTTVIPISLVQ